MSDKRKKIWIDLDNSPHVPFFNPIITELEESGYPVMITVRDCFQVCGLADKFNLSYKCIGRHSGKNKVKKAIGLLYRALLLAPEVLAAKPDLALSHGSRSQMILSSILRIPAVHLFDYEFTSPVPFIHPQWVLMPEIIPDSVIMKMDPHVRMLKYPGIKEDVYVPFFKPDSVILEQMGVRADHLVMTLRPPANEAHYHNAHSDEMFEAAIDWLSGISELQVVLLPRNCAQGLAIMNKWPELFETGKIIIPDSVVDGLNLIWHSDLVVSGGGTMNREAAALGVPVYSIFRGEIGAVDRYLADNGRLVLLERPEDFREKVRLEKWARPAAPRTDNRAALDAIVSHLIDIL